MVTQSSAPLSPASTISDIELMVQNGLEALRNAPLSEQITAALKFLTPPGYRPIAQLEEDGRKKRSTAAASNWSPETGEIVIYFERQEHGDSGNGAPSAPPAASMGSSFLSEDRKSLVQAGLRDDPLKMIRAERRGATSVANHSELAQPQVSDREIQDLCEALAESEKAGKAFVAFKMFRDQHLTARGYAWADSPAYRQAVLTKAVEVGAVVTSSIPNPKAPQHPTTTVKLNRESKYALTVAPRFRPIRIQGGETASEILLRDRGRF